MPDLVVGHTTETSARIWVCGDKRRHTCEVALQPKGRPERQSISLEPDRDYTATVDFVDLQPNTEYAVTATFSPGATERVVGRFRTFKKQESGKEFTFSFVLSSCNLSVIAISNLLTYLLAFGGTYVAVESIDLPKESWRYAKFVRLRRVLRWPARKLVWAAAGLVKWMTGLKQPPPPFLRSPFLKLSAVFESWVIDVVTRDALLPSVGDVVVSLAAKGVVVCAPARVTVTGNKVEVQKAETPGPGEDDEEATWRLVVAQVDGTFAEQEILHRRISGNQDEAPKRIGEIRKSVRCHPWYQRPAFFIHAGDQIYYDFPTEKLVPDRNHYRLAYREAWFDDEANRYLLSHWPHYMTLDDHEIADQFSNDFNPPEVERYGHRESVARRARYLEEATVAYRDYVLGRQPSEPCDPGAPAGDSDRFWYCFNKGDTRFFVLDTRTKRFDGLQQPAQIIDEAQMTALLGWMSRYPADLKFVVTSVPFVAEISEKGSENAPKWSGQGEPRGKAHKPRNPANDKWNAERFQPQRDRIINYIYNNTIERLVFLTGDMHCCYHATMRIGTGSKYSSTVVHELAGGPVNQLQLANETEFDISRIRRPSGAADGVFYEVLLDQFHSQMNGVMHVKVNYVPREQITRAGRAITPEVEWCVIRTLTDEGAPAWTAFGEAASAPPGGNPEPALDSDPKGGAPIMNGLITFSPRRDLPEVFRWPVLR